MNTDDTFVHNRVILTHFDSYSTALVFARWNKTLLWPQALPESAVPMRSPAIVDPKFTGQTVKQALVQHFGLNPDEIECVHEFNHWAQTPSGPVRIHVLRFTTLDAPKAAFKALGGEFLPISLLRASPMSELLLLREVFNLIVGSGGG